MWTFTSIIQPCEQHWHMTGYSKRTEIGFSQDWILKVNIHTKPLSSSASMYCNTKKKKNSAVVIWNGRNWISELANKMWILRPHASYSSTRYTVLIISNKLQSRPTVKFLPKPKLDWKHSTEYSLTSAIWSLEYAYKTDLIHSFNCI